MKPNIARSLKQWRYTEAKKLVQRKSQNELSQLKHYNSTDQNEDNPLKQTPLETVSTVYRIERFKHKKPINENILSH